MKKFLLLLTFLFCFSFSFNVKAETCTLIDNTIVDNCVQSDTNANVLVSWTIATEYTDNKPLPLSDVKGTKIYFHRIIDNHWPPTTTYNNTITSAYVYMTPGEYEVFGTTISIISGESIPSNKVMKTAINNTAKPNPPIITVPNIGTLIINLSG